MPSTIASIFRFIHMHWRQSVIFLTPILLSPLPVFYPLKEIFCGYVVMLMAIYWMTEAIPLAVTALIPLVLYPAFGILSGSDVATNYLTDSNFVFVGSLIMACAIEKSLLHERIALRILIAFGSNPRWLLLGFQLSTCFLSMWLSNTATTAMMVPIAMAVIIELHQFNTFKTDKTLQMSMVFIELGTTDDDHKELEEQQGGGEDEETEEAEELKYKLDLRTVSEPELKIYKGFMLGICYSANIGGTGTLIGTGSNIVLSGQLSRLYKTENQITFATWMMYAVPPMIIYLLASWLWLQSFTIGFRNVHRADERVKIMLRNKYKQLGPLRFDEILVSVLFFVLVMLWLFRDPEVIPGWNSLFEHGFMTDGTSAMFIACLLFVLPSKNPWRMEPGKRPPALMTWQVMQLNFSWSTMFLLGGGYAMAAGVKSSGLSDLLGDKMTSMTVLPHWLFVTVSIALVAFLTEFSSNVATASIFIPLICGVADHVHVNPLYFVLPITLACSFAFMLPVATPPNAIVFSSKLLRVMDMVKAGLVMNLICIPLTVLFTHTWAWWLFDLGHIPKWAAQNITSSAIPPSTI
uniref:Solute carrier family 13 member 3 n=1 Tax=Plectus sambesii TaxID=2011161 RepID=A0A914WR42_9BILA